DLSALGDENICRFYIAVDDAFFVGGIESVGKLNSDVQRACEGEGSVYQQGVKRLAFEQLHGEESPAIVLFDGVHGANSGMVQRRGGARFAQKALEGLRIAMLIFRQELQGNPA